MTDTGEFWEDCPIFGKDVHLEGFTEKKEEPETEEEQKLALAVQAAKLAEYVVLLLGDTDCNPGKQPAMLQLRLYGIERNHA